jgi:hypothetical protein
VDELFEGVTKFEELIVVFKASSFTWEVLWNILKLS